MDSTALLSAVNSYPGFFSPDAPVFVARAPGRLDLMGGIADYSGSLVLQLPLSVGTYVAAQRTADGNLMVLSPVAADVGDEPLFTVPLATLAGAASAPTYREAQALFALNPRTSWAAYVAGALVVLARERKLNLTGGLRLLIVSSVPVGKGVASSASLEVASMQAFCAACGLRLACQEMALLCQRLENSVVGAPCGVMDQMVASCGEEHSLMSLLCRPARLQAPVPLPRGLLAWGLDSGVRHAVSGSGYEAVRVGAFMGYRIIADLAGMDVRTVAPGKVEIADPLYGGYLASIGPSAWESDYAARVLERMGGAEFLARYGGISDAVTQVDPSRTYAVRAPAAHPIYEHYRVSLFRDTLAAVPSGETPDDAQLRLLGNLMYASHASYTACGLGSPCTDRLVEMVQQAGPKSGLFGARITGGGSGGTVAILGRAEAAPFVAEIATRYASETGGPSLVLSGSSPGASAFGVATLLWDPAGHRAVGISAA